MWMCSIMYVHIYVCTCTYVYVFSICSKDSGNTGKYKLVEHKEKYIMESNSCLPDHMKPHFPAPTGATKERPTENHIINGLHETPLSEDAREAFFQARNMGVDTFTTGLQPALSENGTQPIKIFPDYTANATLEDLFVPPTMSCNETIPYGPELYTPFSNASTSSTVPPASHPLSRIPSSANSSVSVSSETIEHNHHSQIQPSYSPSSGYQSSPNMHSASPDSNPLDLLSPQQLDDPDFDELIDALNSESQVQTKPLKKSLEQGNSTFDGIIDELLMENLLENGETFPDLPIYDQSFYYNQNSN